MGHAENRDTLNAMKTRETRWTACFTMPICSSPLRVEGVELTHNAAEHAIHPRDLCCIGRFGTQGALPNAVESTPAASGQRQHLFCVEWRDHGCAPYRPD